MPDHPTHIEPPTSASLPGAAPAPGATPPGMARAEVRSYLAQHPQIRPADLVELLCADQVEHWRGGERIPAEAYLQLHPALEGDNAEAFALVYNEFALREHLGEAPTPAEFLWRFPHFADRLGRQLQLHRALGAAEGLASGPGPPEAGTPTPRSMDVCDSEATRKTLSAQAPGNNLRAPPAVPGYEILSELGRGGMGVVYEARQLALKRTVALKMILAGAHSDPAHLARFRSEAEAVARLQHPHIVQVYEVGEYAGLAFFSLEYVPGGSLDKHLAGTPQPALEAAALVETLARAMHYAHERGVIHRDLKPANVLLQMADGRLQIEKPADAASPPSAICHLPSAIPKISDFGLAKQLENPEGATESGAVMGTPSYMAPEQARGLVHVIGPATDVYSLGAILYEMLTGRPPFRAATPMDTVHQVITEEPVPPARLQPRVPRDLETICLKCLEKEPQRRYAGALALAEDLRRFQVGEPITARPASLAERARKWARRRPTLAALVGVIALAVLCGLGGVLWYNARLRAERDRAETNFHMALGAVDDLLREVGASELADEPHMEQTRRQLLEKALAYFQKFLRQKSDDPVVQKKAGQAYKQMGDVLRLLGRRPEAQAAYEKAIDHLTRLVADDPPDPECRHYLAESYNWLGEVYRGAERHREARAAYQHALAILDRLMADFPRRAVFRMDKARTFYNLGIVSKDTNQPQEADKAFHQAIGILTALKDRFPKEPAYRRELALACLNLSLVQAGRDTAGALATSAEALDLLRPLAEAPPRLPHLQHELAIMCNNRACILILAGRQAKADRHRQAAWFTRAEMQNRRARDIARQLTRDFPSVPAYRKELANIYNIRGAIYYSTDKGKAAAAWAEAALLWRQLVQGDSKVPDYRAKLAETVGNLGLLRLQEKKYEDARSHFKEAVSHLHLALDSNPDKPDYRKALFDQYRRLAETLVQMGDHEAAARAARALAKTPGDNGEGYFLAACFLARCAGKANPGSNLPRPPPETLKKQYADEALDMLRRAMRKGYQVNFADANLDSLRHREEFRRLSHGQPR